MVALTPDPPALSVADRPTCTGAASVPPQPPPLQVIADVGAVGSTWISWDLTGSVYHPGEGAWPLTEMVVVGAVLSGTPWHEAVPESVKELSPSLTKLQS